MKRILLYLFILVRSVLAQDSTYAHLQLKDTSVASIAAKKSDLFFNLNFWQILTSVGAGIILTLIGVYFTNRHQRKLFDEQIQHQREVKQAEIDVATKRKFIDDLIQQSKNISKSIYFVIQYVNELYEYNSERMFNPSDKAETDRLDNKISIVYDVIRNNKEEFYYAVSILFFYLNKNDDNHQCLSVLVEKLKTSYEKYTGYFWAHSHSSENYDIEMKQYGANLIVSYEALKDTTQDIIDTERKNIDMILKKPG